MINVHPAVLSPASMQKGVPCSRRHSTLCPFKGNSPLHVFLGEVSVRVLCPFFNWVVCLPGVESCEFFGYFGDQTLVPRGRGGVKVEIVVLEQQ